MPRNGIREAQASEGYENLPEGAYVLVVTSCEQPIKKDYARLEFDVAEGEWKGHEKGSQWPLSDILSFKPSALGMVRARLDRLSEANPGFDALTAYENDDWRSFEGRRIGAVLRRRLYTRKDGGDGEGVEIGKWISPEDVRSGNWSPMAPRDARTAPQAPAAAPARPVAAPSPQGGVADVYDEDIPF